MEMNSWGQTPNWGLTPKLNARRQIALSAAYLALALLQAGCGMVGPNFMKPAAPAVTTYTEGVQPAATSNTETSQTFKVEQDIPRDWWTLFHSPALNELITAGLKNNPTVAAAQAAFTNARESANVGRDTLMVPAVDASASEERQRLSIATFGTPGASHTFNLTNASVGVSYTLDLFGGNRRRVESLEAQVEASGYLLQAARITLAANIATTAIREAALRAQIHATDDMIGLEGRNLEILLKRETLGAVSQTEVQVQRTALAQTRATLPALQRQLAQTRHQLAAYVGRFPGEAGLSTFELEDITLPQQLPLSVPSALVRQRPDIQVAEAQLHQATADMGVSISNAYPNITLSSSFGSVATRPADMFSSLSQVWSLGAGITQPLFHGGALEAGQRAAQAALDQSAAQYRQIVLNAFQNVADVLRALETDDVALTAQTQATEAAHRSMTLAQVQYAAGAISYPTLLAAQDRDSQVRLNLVQAQANRLADTAALFLALGGGWWNDANASSQSSAGKTP
jgi:NodT family efflux transporter outer membrane factor (OMF) lipoprotein